MKPCALCRWIGSVLPGGYSTVIIRPSLPGKSARSFEKSGVTFASLGWSLGCNVTDIRHTNIKTNFVTVIDNPSFRLNETTKISLVVARSGGGVAVQHAANPPCLDRPACHATCTDCRRVWKSRLA